MHKTSVRAQEGAAAIAIVTLVVGLVIGVSGGYTIGHSKAKTTGSSSMDSSKSSSADMSNMDSADGVTVGGAKMVASKDIVANAQNAKNVSTVVSLVAKADLVDTLKSDGPFTVFAPNNDAFGKIDKATVASLQEPANKAKLQDILKYHVVSGTYTSASLKVMAQKGESLTSVQGEMIMPVMENGKVALKDAKGGMAMIQTADVISSNGVTHVIDSVMMPTN